MLGNAGDGSRIRYQTQVVPRTAPSLDAIATELLEHLDAAMDARTDQEGRTVTQRFSEEHRRLRSLPQRSFEARHVEPVAVSRQALVPACSRRWRGPATSGRTTTTSAVRWSGSTAGWRAVRVRATGHPRAGHAGDGPGTHPGRPG